MIVLAGPTYGAGTGRGDMLTMFPAINALAESFGTAYVAIQDPDVRALLPLSSRIKLVDDLAPHVHSETVVRLDVHAAVAEYCKTMHPTRMFFAQAGLQVPAEVPRPRVNIVRHEGVPYDYVIAPFTNHQELRGWNFEHWKRLVSELTWTGERKLAIVCSEQFPEHATASSIAVGHRSVKIIAGAPLPVVAGIFVNARCVITIDSMANRLAHAVGAQHLLLHGRDATPTAWAYGGGDVTCAQGSEDEYPGGIISADRMSDITVATVMRFAQGIHG